MQNKRIWVRTLTRLLYAGGIVFLVSGVLLSAISIPVIAAGSSALTTQGPTSTVCPCLTQTPISGVTHTPGPGGSSLLFTSGCNCSCTNTQAVVCNVGSSDMKQAVPWDLFFSADGNPVLGQKIETGSLAPLKVGQCTTLNYTPIKPGFYAYVVKQEPTHEGPGTVWSNSCQVSGACFPTPVSPTNTFTPVVPPTSTHTATVPPPPPVSTFTPPPPPVTETATRAPMAINLSAVCGYVGETTMLWKVANHINENLNFNWRVSSGSSETGSGSVAANSDTYFTTSTAAKTVELFVNNERVDTENAVAPCKQNLVLSYACTPEGVAWILRNPNNFPIDVIWKIDNQEGGRGPLGANAQVQLVVSKPGAHTVEVQWTDTRPGTHTVSLTSDVNSCIQVPPITPTVPTATFTETPVPPTLTHTPTVPVPTNTFTFTPTATGTLPVVTLTHTPTPTATNTLPVITSTFTMTPTATNTLVVITNTPTATATNTNTPQPGQTSPPIVIPTFTLTPTPSQTASLTPLPPTATNTLTPVPPTATSSTTPLPAPGFTVTTAPSATMMLTPIPTFTSTATQVNTVPPPVAVSTPIIIPVTGADMLAPARTTGLIGKLFINIGLVMLGMALAMTGLTRRG